MSDTTKTDLAAEPRSATAGTATGPKTAEGEARSSFNHVKHGRFSRHGSLLKYECDRVFLDTYRQWPAAWAPANRFETSLVQQLAHIEWSLFRCRAIASSMNAPPPSAPLTSIGNCLPNPRNPFILNEHTSVRTPKRTPSEPRANPLRTPSGPRANLIRTPFGLPRTRLRTPEPRP